jgi:ubiquinone/menaquinone biosynthesis C-methylase UbiE
MTLRAAQYDSIGGAYDLIARFDLYHRISWGVSTRDYREFADAAMRACGDGTLLDAGCGSMLFTANAYRSHLTGVVVGSDLSSRMLRRARARIAADSHQARPMFVHGDVLSSPFGAESFDVVLCMHIAHVINDLNGLLSESRRILKPGGKLLLTSIVLVGGWRDRHIRALSRQGILAAPRRREEVVEVVRARFACEPAVFVRGSMLFAQATKI